ncbi:MAG: bifunctional 4-hydroxy-2-oxoglutarate aldolase/2-dehydro-3-deoxy-phosphogluconate aldolase [Pirellulales bacterium]|nr:bifunctional 4-hydroxy-2-oxoglutarate aldolase/2-dehydro-3-deoxy-phosphogluconate aldolase [Pirellulales bacterium]
MFCEEVKNRLEAAGVVAVTVVEHAADAVPLARALLAGGIDAMEITMRTAAALDALRAIRAEAPEMEVGAGTVLTPEQARECKAAGASFAVAPGTSPRTMQAAQDCGLSFAPGVMTPSDIETALGFGCRVLKYFPAETAGGIAHLKHIAAPYAHLALRFMPTGGINLDNLPAYLESPLVAAVGGTWLAKTEQIAAGDWPKITATALASKEIVLQLRNKNRS